MLTASDVTNVVSEISPILRGGWIQKIQQPTDRTVVLDVRLPGRTHRLLISCRLNNARVHITTRSLPNPPTPPPFCQFLRARFQGARIDDIRQIEHDRIVELRITSREGAHTILCELTGHKANILVLDSERRVLRDLTLQHQRVGHAYVVPSQPHTPHDRTPSRFSGIGEGLLPISAAMDAYYHEQESTLNLDRMKEARLRVLRKTLKKEQRLIEAWRSDLSKAITYRDYARYGELIKANLGAIAKGTDHIEVTDYFDDALPIITIPLDPMKSPQANMDAYFRKHRKYLAAEREIEPRIERGQHHIARLLQEIKDIEQGNWTPPTGPPAHLPTAATAHAAADTSHRPSHQRRGPFRRFTSTDGLPIYVGRNARENDALTFGLAKSEDLWLHARGTPGSHVVVRLGKGIDPPPETLRDAATLALLYSDLKKSGKGEVIYTRRKWVKKAKGQAPGAVIVTQEKSLHMTLDRKRLDALTRRSLHE